MKIPWFATLVPGSFAITLLEVLQTNSELSTLYSYVNASTDATNFLANSNNFTFLAPSNEAISDLVQSKGNASLIGDLILASVQYGMLKGGFPSLSFSNESKFASTNLVDPAHSNVTGGQAVRLVADDAGSPQVVSGNQSTAAVGDELICTGGIVHIINECLSIPIPAVLEISAARMQYFVSILNTAGYLNAGNADYVDGIMRIPDVTYFIPNSAAALASATLQATNSTAEEMRAVFQYHVVPDFVGYSSALKDGMRLKSQEGSSLTITIQDGETYVNSAKVTASDYIVANGVIHVIEDLLDRFDNSPPPKANSTTTVSSDLTSATSSGSTSEPTPTSSSSDPPASAQGATSGSRGLPSSTRIAIGVGAGAGGFTVLAVLVGCFLRRRKQNSRKSNLALDRDRSPSPMESFYVKGGTIHKKDNGYGMEYKVAGCDRVSSNRGRPEVPPKSPGRAVQRGRGASDSFF